MTASDESNQSPSVDRTATAVATAKSDNGGGSFDPTAIHKGSRSSWFARTNRFGYLLIAAPMIMMIIVLVVPIVFNLYASTFSWRLFGREPVFVGLDNWITVLQDPRWRASLSRTAIFVVSTVTVQVVTGFWIAYILYKHLNRIGLLSVIFLLPMMISEVAAALTWRLIVSGSNSLLNWAIGFLGIEAQQWLGPSWAFITVVAVDAWQNVPFVVLIMFAAMQAMPTDVLEAAELDGASGFSKLRYILMPLLQPALLVVLLFRTIFAIRAFTTIWVLTGGGPGDRTAVIGIDIYRVAFSNFNVGMSAVLSMLMVVISLIIGIGYIRMLTREPLS